MPDIPEEAVQAAAEALRRRDFRDKSFEGYARAVLEAAAPALTPGSESWRERAEKAEAAAARVRRLHLRSGDRGRAWCKHCSENDYPRYETPWPCPTIAALDDTRDDARKDEPMNQVITTDASDRYHASEECAAFQAGRRGSEAHGYALHEVRTLPAEEAEAAGKTACPGCVTP